MSKKNVKKQTGKVSSKKSVKTAKSAVCDSEKRSRIPTKCNGTGPRSKNDDSIK